MRDDTVVELRERVLVAARDERDQGLVGEMGVVLAHGKAIQRRRPTLTRRVRAPALPWLCFAECGVSVHLGRQPNRLVPPREQVPVPHTKTRGAMMRRGIIALGAVGLLTAVAVVGARHSVPGTALRRATARHR